MSVKCTYLVLIKEKNIKCVATMCHLIQDSLAPILWNSSGGKNTIHPFLKNIMGHTASEAYLYVTEQEAGHTLDRLQVYCSDNVEREFRITNLT